MWYHSGVRHQLKRIHSLRKQCKCNPSSHNSHHLSLAEHQLQCDILDARANYEGRLVTEFSFSNDSRVYHYIKSLSGQNKLPDVMFWGSDSASTAAGKANLFNEFFHSVFNGNVDTLTLDTLCFPDSSLCSINISLEDTFTTLTSLDPSKAMGGDGIPPIILKHAAVALLEPIHHLFILCLSKSYLPVEWHWHHITPIHKSGDKSTISNYCPISLLCCISKVLEKIIFDKVYDFVKAFISDLQFGFVKNRSMLQQLLLYSELLSSAYDDCHQVDSIYLDIRKAFDTVPHTKLLSKLWDAGITGNLWVFFKAYLSDRRQCVVINTQSSEWLPVSSGVPQGSILGPLMFILYINDLPSLPSSSHPFLFAVDTKCYTHVLSLSDSSLLQADLDRICYWSSQSSLAFNMSKCCLLSFHNRSVSSVYSTYHLDGAPIPSLDHCRDLGVILSNNLSWSLQYDAISAKAYR